MRKAGDRVQASERDIIRSVRNILEPINCPHDEKFGITL
jgi:hypothetical protein